jgi:allantoate deiminase
MISGADKVGATSSQSVEGFMGAAIVARLNELAAISDEGDALTRLYLSPSHRRAVDIVAGWMRSAGMSARVDATGNVVGRYESSQADSKTLILGSHIDTVRSAGKYDGNLGVIAAIQIVERLHREGRRLPFAVEVVAFGDEEGVRFPSTLVGSRALSGLFDPAALDECDAKGVSRWDALIAFGCDPSRVSGEAREPGRTLGYVELHIEQGPVLEAEGLPVAVVSAINGASRGHVVVRGESGHAGALPMTLRRDALAAAAEMILAIERRAKADVDLVATVGRIEVQHSATNTVPGLVTFSLDIRAPQDRSRKAAERDIIEAVASIARSRSVIADVDFAHDAPASTCDPHLSEALAASIARLGFKARRMPSGAGHDAMAFAGRIPFGMLFVRCRGGVSHNPAEYASQEDIDVGSRVLADFVDHFSDS